MPRGVTFTPRFRKVLSELMKEAWKIHKGGREVAGRRVRFNPKRKSTRR